MRERFRRLLLRPQRKLASPLKIRLLETDVVLVAVGVGMNTSLKRIAEARDDRKFRVVSLWDGNLDTSIDLHNSALDLLDVSDLILVANRTPILELKELAEIGGKTVPPIAAILSDAGSDPAAVLDSTCDALRLALAQLIRG